LRTYPEPHPVTSDGEQSEPRPGVYDVE
jgi:hypothetical protein